MRIDGGWCKDERGRTLLLRGVNLSGSTKVPVVPNGATYLRDQFFEHRAVSFVGRPFPLAEADEHFGRLRAWGLTFLRLLTTWEAVEHAGPGQYDEDYLQYLRQIAEKAAEYEITVFIDPHQDVWSRWTGGDGAPGWTLEALGFDLSRLDATGTAITHQMHGDPFPRMIWPTNYTKLACATMFTLFFGGHDFAPATLIDGVPAQEYLQGHYIEAMVRVAQRLADLPNVIGFDTLNEPGSGLIGVDDLNQPVRGLVLAGASPTPFQSMLLGAGYPQDVAVFEVSHQGVAQNGTTRLNPDGLSIWRAGFMDVWRQNGVWTDEDGTPRLLRPQHFVRADGRPINFADEYLKPFMLRYIEAIRSVSPEAIIFLEGVPGSGHPQWGPGDPQRVINAGHWYDVATLMTKRYNPEVAFDFETGDPIVGVEAARQAFIDQIGSIKLNSLDHMGGIPTLIGEFGIPFDLDDKAAYRSGDFGTHVAALDAYLDAMDTHLLNFTLWNYTPDNTNERGDLWNDEDLSLFSRDQQTDPSDINSGGRGLAGVVRPYARATAGELLGQQFDLATRTFEMTFQPDPKISEPTEIFVPVLQYPKGYTVTQSAGTSWQDAEGSRLLVEAVGVEGPITVWIKPV